LPHEMFEVGFIVYNEDLVLCLNHLMIWIVIGCTGT
jgi:hypothetical protein